MGELLVYVKAKWNICSVEVHITEAAFIFKREIKNILVIQVTLGLGNHEFQRVPEVIYSVVNRGTIPGGKMSSNCPRPSGE